ncbi:MAG: glycosyltransferase [Parabacteroides sp.]|nr:glycosyltransferase [Parabacteroides sp.]
MMKKIRIYFTDFWKDLDMNDNFITKFFKNNKIDFEICSSPDYLFCSSFGNEHLKYKDCVKIYFTGENNVPDFNLFDYALSFHPLFLGDRHLRFPLYLLYKGYDQLTNKQIDKETVLNRKFCNFVYSNASWADPIRDQFFHELSKYKPIDSGGRHLNNIGRPVPDKMVFIKDYKFTIAFENSSLPGYTTEKIMEPMIVNSIPIYWGNPDVGKDFNEKSFVHIKDKATMDLVIEEIIRLDSDDDYYLEKLSEPWLLSGCTYKDWFSSLDAFLFHIIEQPLEEAKRCTEYGYVKRYKQQIKEKENFSKLFFWRK